MKNFSLFEKEERIECKPFIKWVGGKGQLLPEINKLYPVELGKNINKYAEIFVGGGAVLFDILSKYKTKVIKIRYVANDIVEVTAEISIPDITKSFDNYMQLMSEDDIFNERKLAEMSKLPKEEFEDIIIEKMFDNMTKSFKNIEGYTSMKGTIYLEKDNGRWGVAELDEKVRNFREMYKKSK